MTGLHRGPTVVGFVCLGWALAASASPQERPLPVERLTITAPGSAGGRWDQTARAMQHVLERTGLAREIQVLNSPGAGGAIGLAQFVGTQRGRGDTLLVGGLVMVSAIRANRAAVSIAQTTPIARLTGEYELIAVPVASDVRGMSDLVRALRVSPGSVSWAGGSVGGPDPLLLSKLAHAIGVEPAAINYVAVSGADEVADALLRNQVAVGISGYRELAPYIDAGRLRALAVSSPQRLPGVAVRTLREQGVDVALVNWRGVFAPPAITDEQRARLEALVDAMVRTDAWHEVARRRGWTELYLAGAEFARFLEEEQLHATQPPDLRRTQPATRPEPVPTSGTWLRRNRLGLGAALGATVLCVVVAAWRWTATARHGREATLHPQSMEAQSRKRSAATQDLLQDMSEQIESQFERWGLTAAEREVAWSMLKGLRHKEIALIRGTSERTVRQQALTVYKKAGLDGRTDFSAFFLSDLLRSQAAPKGHPVV